MGSAIKAQLGSKSAINDESTSRCHSTLFASKCDHLDRAMLLLALLDSPSVFFMLATIGIVDCTFRRLPVAGLRPVPFPFFCAWNGHFTSVWTGRNGMEMSPFFGSYCTLESNFYADHIIKLCTYILVHIHSSYTITKGVHEMQ